MHFSQRIGNLLISSSLNDVDYICSLLCKTYWYMHDLVWLLQRFKTSQFINFTQFDCKSKKKFTDAKV